MIKRDHKPRKEIAPQSDAEKTMTGALMSFAKECINLNNDIELCLEEDRKNEDRIVVAEPVIIEFHTKTNEIYWNIAKKYLGKEFDDIDKILLFMPDFAQSLINSGKWKDNIAFNEAVNFLLNVKLTFINIYFENLLPVFRELNKKGFTEKTDILKYLIEVHEKALLPSYKINAMNSYVTAGKKYYICKATSDNYCNEIIKIYKEKLRILQPDLFKIEQKHPFPVERLSEYFKKDNIDFFIEVEKELLRLKYFDNNLKWIRSQKKLIALILKLHHLKYFAGTFYNSSNKKQEKLLKELCHFFEDRYTMKINDMFKPSKRASVDFKSDYMFIKQP